MQRRTLLQGALVALCLPTAVTHAATPAIQVYKTPSCGCCHEWVAHLRKSGFTVNTTDVPDTAPYRTRYGVPTEMASCHTGVVQGYALEGHVPAEQIKRLLAEKPKAKGLAVPGMPMGSPGMEMDDHRRDAFDVVLIKADGKHQVYRHYTAS